MTWNSGNLKDRWEFKTRWLLLALLLILCGFCNATSDFSSLPHEWKFKFNDFIEGDKELPDHNLEAMTKSSDSCLKREMKEYCKELSEGGGKSFSCQLASQYKMWGYMHVEQSRAAHIEEECKERFRGMQIAFLHQKDGDKIVSSVEMDKDGLSVWATRTKVYTQYNTTDNLIGWSIEDYSTTKDPLTDEERQTFFLVTMKANIAISDHMFERCKEVEHGICEQNAGNRWRYNFVLPLDYQDYSLVVRIKTVKSSDSEPSEWKPFETCMGMFNGLQVAINKPVEENKDAGLVSTVTCRKFEGRIDFTVFVDNGESYSVHSDTSSTWETDDGESSSVNRATPPHLTSTSNTCSSDGELIDETPPDASP